MEVQAVTPRAVDGYIQTLQKTKSVSTKTRKAVTTYVSDKTIEKIIKLLRCAFKQAVIRQIKRCLFRQIKTGLSEHLTMG